MLRDTDLMPFGKFRGCKMEDVPARYLDWLRDQPWLDKWPQIDEYIEDNVLCISAELDGINEEY